MKGSAIRGTILTLISIPSNVIAQELPSPGRVNQEAFVRIPKDIFDEAGQIGKIECLGEKILKYWCEDGLYVADYSPNFSNYLYSLCFKGRDVFAPNQDVFAPNQRVFKSFPKVVYVNDGFWLALDYQGTQPNQSLRWHEGESIDPVICPKLKK